MKKIIVMSLLVLGLGNIAFADEYSNFMNSLKLTENQKQKINEIEKNYKCEIAKLRADVILMNMQLAKAGANPKGQNMLNSGFGALQDELDELELRKQDEIASTLRFFQRIKYRRYCKKLASDD